MDSKFAGQVQHFLKDDIKRWRSRQDEVRSGVLFVVVLVILLAAGMFLMIRAPGS